MKTVAISMMALAGSWGLASASSSTPVAKVLSMLSDLQAKVISEGEVAQKEYAEFAEWCEDRSRNLGFEIKTGKSEVASLNADIAKESSTVAAMQTKVEELAGELSQDEADLKAATHIRQAEQATFATTEADLVETVDMLQRAELIIEREMKGGASMLQLKSAQNLTQALRVLVQASFINSADAGKLAAFMQSSAESDDGDVGAPAGAVYESHSDGIFDTLQHLRETAEDQLDAARKTETSDKHNYDMLRQSLEDQISYGQKEFDEAKRGIAESSEKKSIASGDLGVTSKELAQDAQTKSTLHHDCMTRAEHFEAETKSRGEELAALAKAKQIIRESTAAALSFLEVSSGRMTSQVDLSVFESARIVRDLARKEHSLELAQLAAKMTASMHSSGGDQFKKIKGLIRDMIAELESEAEADATKKSWCDKNLAYINQKKAEKTTEIEKLTTRIDRADSKSAQLKGEVAALQGALANLAQSQAEMNRLRSEEKAAYQVSHADLEQGLEGLKLALNLLNEYYREADHSHDAAVGAADGIIGLLEVCESDFTRDLARVISDEDSAVSEYKRVSKANEIEKASKMQSVVYKSKEFKRLDDDSADLSGDRRTVQTELDAAQESLTSLEEQCIEKAETYASRKARFEAEIAGLKQALDILENETALLQRRHSRHQL